MNPNLIITADLGGLRAFRVTQEIGDHGPHVAPVGEFHTHAADEKLSDVVTDQAGRFPRGRGAHAVPGNLSAGENHNLDEEQRRRHLRQIGERISTLLKDKNVGSCFLAVSPPIHKQLLETLDHQARAKISRVLASNLTKVEGNDLLGHFKKAAAAR